MRPAPATRRATPADAHAIAEISVAGWRAAYRGLMPDAYLDSISVFTREIAWQARLEGDGADLEPAWVAIVDGEVAGYVSSGPPRDDDIPHSAAEIYAIYVHPAKWRSGAGRALLDVATAEWRARGTDALVLWVLEGNARARAFYEAMGWAADDTRKEFDMGGFATVEVRYRAALR